MGEFFKGWRRKAGCVTLVMACVFMGLWVRTVSRRADFVFIRPDFQTSQALVSSPFGIGWNRQQELLPNAPLTIPNNGSIGIGSEPCEETIALDDTQFVKWKWEWLGIRIGNVVYDDGPWIYEFELWIVPHWMFVFPLTLLSAFLLLSKPRPQKRAAAVEPPGEPTA